MPQKGGLHRCLRLALLLEVSNLTRMQPSNTDATSPTIVLRRKKLDALRRANGIDTESELARIIGVSPTTLWRVSKGEVEPSAGFIARTLLAFPHTTFANLFEVVAAPTERVA